MGGLDSIMLPCRHLEYPSHPVPSSELENPPGAAMPSGWCMADGLQELEPSSCQGQQADRLGGGNGKTASVVDSLTIRARRIMSLETWGQSGDKKN